MKLTIESSTFRNSRFCRGLIYYRPTTFEPQMRSLTNHTHIFMTLEDKLDTESFIILKDSYFFNLNAYKNLTALVKYDGVTP